uniref:Uncharacterized protein n=1 Tax=Solanum lycopersicum TaxID=4081 RepID=A0A3Q7EY03_SOLLC
MGSVCTLLALTALESRLFHAGFLHKCCTIYSSKAILLFECIFNFQMAALRCSQKV